MPFDVEILGFSLFLFSLRTMPCISRFFLGLGSSFVVTGFSGVLTSIPEQFCGFGEDGAVGAQCSRRLGSEFLVAFIPADAESSWRAKRMPVDLFAGLAGSP